MLINKIKLNGNKTAFIKMANGNRAAPASPAQLKVCVDETNLTLSAWNFGVTFNSEMSLVPYIQTLCKSANYQLHGISRIWKYLTPDATVTLMHSLIISRLDYFQCAFWGIILQIDDEFL